MAEQTAKTKKKRLSKSERTHQRRLKQAARKPGGALALHMAKAVETAKEPKKQKDTEPKPKAGRSPVTAPVE